MSDTPDVLTIDPNNTTEVCRLAEALVAEMCTQGHEWDETKAFEVRAHMRAALYRYGARGGMSTEAPDLLGALIRSVEAVRDDRHRRVRGLGSHDAATEEP